MTSEEMLQWIKCPECRELKKPCPKCCDWINNANIQVEILTCDRCACLRGSLVEYRLRRYCQECYDYKVEEDRVNEMVNQCMMPFL